MFTDQTGHQMKLMKTLQQQVSSNVIPHLMACTYYAYCMQLKLYIYI